MVIISVIILLTTSPSLGAYVDYGDVIIPELEERTLPADLLYINKTDRELELEDCMENFSICIAYHRGALKAVCASSRLTREKETFESLCEMNYENCKLEDRTWEYFHDEKCDNELA